jgi:hypothetical protein
MPQDNNYSKFIANQINSFRSHTLALRECARELIEMNIQMSAYIRKRQKQPDLPKQLFLNEGEK